MSAGEEAIVAEAAHSVRDVDTSGNVAMTTELSRRQFVKRTAAGALAAGLSVPAMVKAAADEWGDLVGRFQYDGKAPPRKRLKVDKDLECCGKFEIFDESLMVGEDGGLGNVYVYIRNRGVPICPELAQEAEDQTVLDNLHCIFVPHCMTIWYPKQKFHIINSDPVAQNVAFQPPGDTPANIVLPVRGKATHTFRRKQTKPVKIACNYHPWESAYILPRDNPYMAVSALDGTFEIPKLPVGVLEFQVWHEKVEYLDTPTWAKGRFAMTIKPGTNDLKTIKLDPDLLKETK